MPVIDVYSTGSKWAYRLPDGHGQNGFDTKDAAAKAGKDELNLRAPSVAPEAVETVIESPKPKAKAKKEEPTDGILTIPTLKGDVD